MAARDQRGPGSDRGRPACNWEGAFVFWAALPAERRSYAAVATEFGVSIRTVERHGRLEGWQQRLQAINARAAAETDARLGHAKAELIGRLRTLIGSTLAAYSDMLRRGEVRISPADLDRLLRLWQQLDEELETSASAPAAAVTSAPIRPVDHARAVVQALAESGALTELGLQIIGEYNGRNDGDRQRRDTDDEGV